MYGEWKLVDSQNFEELMKELGVNFVLRKLGNTTKPNVNFSVNGDEWTFTTTSAIKTSQLKFKLNEEFDEETLDGRKVKVLIYNNQNLKRTFITYSFKNRPHLHWKMVNWFKHKETKTTTLLVS